VRSILQTIATQDDLLDLRNEIGKIKANNIKWMFIFWVAGLAPRWRYCWCFL